jgi:hypothetical protein
MNVDKIAKELSEEFGIDVSVAKFEFEDLCRTLKLNTPTNRDLAYVKQLKNEYLDKIVNYDDDGAGWTMKVKNIYYNRNELIFEGSGIDWTDNDSDGINGMIILRNMRRVVDESMVDELEIYDMGDVEEMITDMADAVIAEAQALMGD